MYEKIGNDCEMFYRYDPDGRLSLVFQCDIADGAKHYYYPVTNSRGDIMEIHNGPGEITAKYNYDAWGKLLSVTDANGNVLPKTSFAYKISVRYRGYEYDAETGLYYLQSRYYDPETGRFINADDAYVIGYSGEDISYNAFTYCDNNPVNKADYFGYNAILMPFRRVFSLMYAVIALLAVLGVVEGLTVTSTVSPIAIIFAGGVAIIGIGTIVYDYKSKAKVELSKRTNIPSKLKNKDGTVKTPDTNKDEFKKDKHGDFIHQKTKWKFHLDKSGHFGGPHWDASPPNGKPGDYYDISRSGGLLK